MKKLLITGPTGFLGSNLTGELVSKGYQIIGLKRSLSNLWRCREFCDKITWVNCDNLSEAAAELVSLKPDILIHTAWNGVKASERDNWYEQEKNLSFFVTLLEIIKKTGVTKIISLGSQAEYGAFEVSVDEGYTCNPNSAYGAVKLCASTLLKAFSEQNNIDWYWIRLFSVFGPGEDKNWLIPSAIYNLLEKKEMKLTACEQKYDYLYVKDFVSGIIKILENDQNKSGIYNMSGGKSISLKDILAFLEDSISPVRKILQIGALPYRPNQIMNMEGNSELFFRTFNFKPIYDVFDGLTETIKYYESIMKQ